MAVLIKDGAIVADPWRQIMTEEELEVAASDEGRSLLLALPLWLAHGPHLAGQGHAVSVWLEPDDDLEAVTPALNTLPLIAIHFPVFTDGRGYSQARLLRQRHGFGGELRATGDIQRDQIYLLHRCGFNSFALREDQDPSDALSALRDFSWSPVLGR